MPSIPTPPPELEVLTFLSDPNAQVRQVALSNIVGFSAKDSPHRSLLISKHKNRDGSPLLGRDGKEVDTLEDLKRLCQDQPITAHDAFSALINISDSLVLARKIGDKAFLALFASIAVDLGIVFLTIIRDARRRPRKPPRSGPGQGAPAPPRLAGILVARRR